MEVDRRAFDAMLADYLSSRDEMHNAISNQQMVLTFGTALIVGVAATGAALWTKDVAPGLLMLLPAVAAWTLALWLGEVVRMLRSVAFCEYKARVVNDHVADDDVVAPIEWESWRQDKAHPERTISWTYFAVVAGLYLVGAGGLVAAIVANTQLPAGRAWSSLGVFAGVAMNATLGLVVTAYLYRVYGVWIRRDSGVGPPPAARPWFLGGTAPGAPAYEADGASEQRSRGDADP